MNSDPPSSKQKPITAIVFLVAGAVLLISMALVYSTGLAALKSNRQLAHQREVIEHLVQLVSSLKDAETGQRGYLLTGDEAYLDPYNKALAKLPKEMEILRQLASQGELPSKLVSNLNQLVSQKLAELDRTIQLRREGDPAKALELVRSSIGKDLMDTIRSEVSGMEAQELAEFQEASRQTIEATKARNGTFLGATLLNLVFLAWAYRRIATEIRSREQAQMETRESAARLRTIVGNLTEGVVASDLDGNILHWNSAALEMYDLKTLKEAQKNLKEFTAQFEFSTLERVPLPFDQWPLSRVLRGEMLRDWEVRARHKVAGWEKVFSYGGSLVRDDAGRPLLAVLAIGDTTHRRRMEEELRQSHTELERRVEQRTAELAAANKELEAFGYSVSHDLRAPLRHVSGFIKLLEKGSASQLDDNGRLQVRTIAQAAERMGHLIDDLLLLSRIGRAAFTETNVNLLQLVDEARQQLAPETADRAIEWQIGPLPQMRGDITLLRSAVVNLLSNAVKYTRNRNPARIEIGSRDESGETIVFVRDNGAGFDMQFLDKLFGVFQRLHDQEEFEGTGIGLASVRRVIQRHGGRTWAEGAVDQGATFYFSIPKERLV